MRVDGSPGKINVADLNGPHSRPELAGDSAPPSPIQTAETYQPTGDVQRLLDALRQTPVVRPEVIAEVVGRLNAGELNTPKATEETVSAILGATLPNA
jgi:hypothetical protein